MTEVVQILVDKERLQPLANSIKTLKGSDADITLAEMEDTVEAANEETNTYTSLLTDLEAAINELPNAGDNNNKTNVTIKCPGIASMHLWCTYLTWVSGKLTSTTYDHLSSYPGYLTIPSAAFGHVCAFELTGKNAGNWVVTSGQADVFTYGPYNTTVFIVPYGDCTIQFTLQAIGGGSN